MAVWAAGLAAAPAWSDEGMWTFNQFPVARVEARYGFAPTPAWLDHLRLASVRIAGGCSASVVSPGGLVMTNHHCARRCIDAVSALTHQDYERDGFLARTLTDELRCPGMELNQLSDISDVTGRVQAATAGATSDRFFEVQKAAIAAIEKECATSDRFRCDVVSLYRGGRYDLYRYRRLQDIRLAFAPEEAIAFFGGDPDNFNFPRYDLDVAFLRIYAADGQPMKMEHFLAWSDGDLREGDLTFVSGHPGGTSRELTLAQLDDDRDMRLPAAMNRASELRGFLTQYQARGAEQQRHSSDDLFSTENGLKGLKGRHAALADKAFYGQLVQREQDFRNRVRAQPELQNQYGTVWDEVAGLVQRLQALRKAYGALERGQNAVLFGLARGLVRYAAEIGKPNGERLTEYTDSRLPQYRLGVLSKRPVYKELEAATLGWSLTKLREDLGPDHALVKRLFARLSPQEVARAAVQGSQLDDLQTDPEGNATGGLRKRLLDGGKAAIDASNDPMLELARAIDPAARAIRKQLETEVEGPLRQAQEKLARARFAVYGDSKYPDATFTLRLSFGAVRGYVENGKTVQPFTAIAGAFERHTGAAPYALPASWLAAQDRLGPRVPFNFVTTNDIIGGNSGSPMVNREGQLVGLVFDGNIQSLGGDYGFDESVNRTVAVHSAVLLEALDTVYGARRLADEIRGGSGSGSGRGTGQPKLSGPP
jgi:hypothetical protein